MFCIAVPGAFARPPAAPKSGPGAIVIVFKDGHRQSFNLSEIERVEFAGVPDSAPVNAAVPPRGHFLGKWEVGDGNGRNFYITLDDTGDAMRSIGGVHGKWVYVDGEVRVTWDDGAKDAIRKEGSGYRKFAYGGGKSFTETPDNVANARNTTQHPI
jgi:hypothetical protein